MTVIRFILTYTFGGLTFLPLLIAAIFLPAWLRLPRVDEKGSAVLGRTHTDRNAELISKQSDGEDHNRQHAQEQEEQFSPDGAISGSFTVLRKYDFQAALASLNARSNGNDAGAPGSAAGIPRNSITDDGSGASSESVYQTMYRSVFDRKARLGNGDKSILANEDEDEDPQGGSSEAGAPTARRKPPVGANAFYIVLRHGHLMLYNSAQQLEVRHVISLAHHRVSLSEGLDDDEDPILEADLFIKRTAIVLTPTQSLPNGHSQHHASTPRPIYLFSSLCSEKETFYHALLNSTLSPPPIPQMLLLENTIKLQAALHSTSLTPETRAFNALVSRIFLSIHRAPALEDMIRQKIEKKIARVQKPAFLAALAVESIDLGDAAPILSNPRLKDLNVSGDLTLAFDVRYSGGIKVVISAAAKLDLGTRFKTRTFSLLLSTCLARLSGHVLVRMKPPPSNRIWFSFDSMPDMEIKVEPVVSQRQITYGFVLKAIEDRIRAVVADTLVKPNWDDVPFFDTRSQKLRGGVWQYEGGDVVSEQHPERSSEKRASVGSTTASVDVLAAKNEKTMSAPALLHPTNDADSSAASSSSEHTATAKPSPLGNERSGTGMKRRAAPSNPHISAGGSSPPAKPPRPPRSPSFPSPSPAAPSIALDSNATASPVRSDDANLQPKRWAQRAGQHPPIRKEAVDAVREMRDRAVRKSAASLPATSTHSPPELADDGLIGTELSDEPDELSATDGEDVSEHVRRYSDTSVAPSTTTSASKASSLRSPRRTDSNLSVSSRGSHATTTSRSRAQQKKTILAATAAATTAARQWGWNAIANRQKGVPIFRAAGGVPRRPRDGNSATPDTEEPIGRGQPLPPPGTPLPRPQQRRTLWNGAGLGGAGGPVKRKPVLPARRPTQTPSIRVNGQREETSSMEELAVMDRERDDVVNRHSDNQTREEVEGHAELEDEFGPWRENSGTYHQVDDIDGIDELGGSREDNEARHESPEDDLTQSSEVVEAVREPSPHPEERRPAPKVPPPLPRRRKPVPLHAAVEQILPAASETEDVAESTDVPEKDQASSLASPKDGAMSADREHPVPVDLVDESVEATDAGDAAALPKAEGKALTDYHVTVKAGDRDQRSTNASRELQDTSRNDIRGSTAGPDALAIETYEPSERDIAQGGRDDLAAELSPSVSKSVGISEAALVQPTETERLQEVLHDHDEELIDFR